ATTSTTGGTTSTTTGAAVCASVARLAGADRIATAIATSQGAYPTAGSAKAVVLAQDVDFPDALAGGPLAADVGGPLLLTAPDQLSATTLAEIQRLLPAKGTVILLGGTSALSAAVTNALTTAGFTTTRLAGDNRFATAVAIANAINPTTVFEATGLDYPDALSAGPAAVANHAAILLTNGSTQAPETAAYLSAHTSDTRDGIGGPAAMADPTATSFVGTDRYATSAMVATELFNRPKAVGVASGLAFPDALTAVPLLGPADVPMLLVAPSGALPASVSSYLTSNASTIEGIVAFGGTTALADSVLSEMTALIPAFANSASTGCTTGSTTSTTTMGSTTSTTTMGSTTSTTTMASTTTGSAAGAGGVLGGGLSGILSLLTGGTSGSGLGGITSLLSGLGGGSGGSGTSSILSGLLSGLTGSGLTSGLSSLSGGGTGGLPIVSSLTGGSSPLSSITSILSGLTGGGTGGLPIVSSL
ncbi:MAG: cell wall-binding repeat-containing protein, partial [Candidatus Dormibacteria bacterium]